MRTYSNIISLSKNSRGIYSLDPTMGCSSGMKLSKNGCYNDCYAARASRVYGYDFSKTVKRDFINQKHIEQIKREIKKIPLPFVRMGTMGDPSEDWTHTLSICEKIQTEFQYSLFETKPKEIVIITKHWTNLTEDQLIFLSSLNVCINTSISVMDQNELFYNSLNQYERLKPYCKSILRIVSCDFNENSIEGKMLKEKQKFIFDNYKVLDTVFRVSKNNPIKINGIINTHETKFLNKKSIISKYNKKTYFGKCDNCLEMCGVNINL